MIASIIIAAISCVALIASVIFLPEIKIKKITLPVYPFVALIGAVAAVAATPLTLGDCVKGITGSGAINPLKILALFISVTAISVFLDEAGFFEFLAGKILSKAGKSQTKLFFVLYATVSVLTVFTSNDIIILTFTPFIIYFCNSAHIRALPYLLAEFVAANTWSMALIIGNPTNIYLATSAAIGFFGYVKTMILPTIASGVASAVVLYLLFRKSLKEEFDAPPAEVAVKSKPMCILGVCVLAVCTVSLAVSSFLDVEMWTLCLICAGVLFIIALVICAVQRKKPSIVGKTLVRLPYQLIPFVLGMFIISLSLDKTGVTAKIAGAFSSLELPLYGVTSFLASNLMNNIPMSIVYSSMITAGNAGEGAVYASIIGSNLGAVLTPVGALAGIMFSSITQKHGVKISAFTFIKYGACISIVSLAVALATLYAVLSI